MSKQSELYKRNWIYVQNPKVYGFHCDVCGESNIEWSEFEGHIFCKDCKIDTKGTGSIFDGPIDVNAATMLGISFDRLDIQTNKLQKFNLKTKQYE